MANADPVYEYQSSGLFKQSQLSANIINARINPRYSLFGLLQPGNAYLNTDGVNDVSSQYL